MIIYLKYFFLFPKLSHNYILITQMLTYLFKFNLNFLFNIKKVLYNYSNVLTSWLKFFKKSIITNNLKSVSFNLLANDAQLGFLYNKRSFHNIFLKNNFNKNLLDFNLQLSSVYTLLYLYNNFSFFKHKFLNFKNYSSLLTNLKFNYFVMLINCNWHLILNINNIFSSIRYSLVSIIKLKGIRQYGLYSTSFLWKFWSNFFLLILNISFYNVQILSFSRIYFKKIIDPFNWLMWSWSFYFWKVINKNFFFKYTNLDANSKNFFINLKSWFFGILFILDSNFHLRYAKNLFDLTFRYHRT